MSRNGLTWLGVAMALLVLAADQASKYWIKDVLHLQDLGTVAVLPVLNLTWVENRGITFGILSGNSGVAALVLGLIALAVVAVLGVWLRRADSRLVATALGAICGGAVGNVIDRARFGWVVDFIHTHAWGWSWYVFNVADAAIVCGVAALVFDSLQGRKRTDLARDPRHG
jgi:lipoprotein signal peptidase